MDSTLTQEHRNTCKLLLAPLSARQCCSASARAAHKLKAIVCVSAQAAKLAVSRKSLVCLEPPLVLLQLSQPGAACLEVTAMLLGPKQAIEAVPC